MALIGNYSVLQKTSGSFRSGLSIAQVRSNYGDSGSLKNAYLHFGLLASFPDGYSCPYSWSMPMGIGAMSSFTDAQGIVSPLASMAGGYNLEVTDTLTMINVNAQLDQIVSFVASSVMELVSSGQLNAAIQMQGSASLLLVTSANIGAIVDALASSSMGLSTSSVLTALAHLDAQAGGATPLSPEGLAASLLDGNEIETGFTVRESLRLILSALSGKLSGAGGTTISIRDINDSIDRIIATVDANGNRTSVTLNKD